MTASHIYLENKMFHTNHKSNCQGEKNQNFSVIMVKDKQTGHEEKQKVHIFYL